LQEEDLNRKAIETIFTKSPIKIEVKVKKKICNKKMSLIEAF
jgi:hypothetical protein